MPPRLAGCAPRRRGAASAPADSAAVAARPVFNTSRRVVNPRGAGSVRGGVAMMCPPSRSSGRWSGREGTEQHWPATIASPARQVKSGTERVRALEFREAGPLQSPASGARSASREREEDTMKIGFIGLGNMGGPMALNLLRAGHDLLVHDVRRETAAPHLAKGARWTASPREAAGERELILTSLPGPAEVEAVATGSEGVIQGAVRGAIYADLSTGSPTVRRRIHAAFAQLGVPVVD